MEMLAGSVSNSDSPVSDNTLESGITKSSAQGMLKRKMQCDGAPERKKSRHSRHHLVKHVLDPSMTGDAALKHYDGVSTIEDALALTSAMSQKDLQRTFAKVYGMKSSSNNNNWLRKKLMEALSPTGWRNAWNHYMSNPFSNRGKKDRLRKIEQAERLQKSYSCHVIPALTESLAKHSEIGQWISSNHQREPIHAPNKISDHLQEWVTFQKQLQSWPQYVPHIDSMAPLHPELLPRTSQKRESPVFSDMPPPPVQRCDMATRDIIALLYDLVYKRRDQHCCVQNGNRSNMTKIIKESTVEASPLISSSERGNNLYPPVNVTNLKTESSPRIDGAKEHAPLLRNFQPDSEVIDLLQSWIKSKQQ